MIKHIGIVAGGPFQEIPPLKQYHDIDYWIGVDEGTLFLIEEGFVPDLAIGDFDSMKQSHFEMVEDRVKKVKIYPKEKNETDLELAILETIHLNPISVSIFGATGGRLDHAWANVHLLDKFTCKNIDAWLIDKQNQLTVKRPGKYQLKIDPSFPYVSFLPLTEKVESLTLEGFLYPLTEYTISLGSARTVSNEWSKKIGTYFFTSGIILVIKSRDQA